MEQKPLCTLDCKLVQHCIKLGADVIWKNTLRIESLDLMRSGFKKDMKMIEIKTSTISGANQGAFATIDIPDKTEIGLIIAQSVNDVEMLLLPPAFDRKLLEETVDDYVKTKTKCNVEYLLQKNAETGNYYFHMRTIKRINKGEELFIHYNPEQWIVMNYLQPSTHPEKNFTPEQIELLSDQCIKCIVKSTKRAFSIYSFYDCYRLSKLAPS